VNELRCRQQTIAYSDGRGVDTKEGEEIVQSNCVTREGLAHPTVLNFDPFPHSWPRQVEHHELDLQECHLVATEFQRRLAPF
jgi:hypothetical protein